MKKERIILYLLLLVWSVPVWSQYREVSPKVSLIIPLNSGYYHYETPPNSFVDMYNGFLLAANDLKESGQSAELNIIDSKEYLNSTAIIESGVLDNSQLIIGPVYSADMKAVLDYANEREIPLVSPMDPAAEKYVKYYPGLIQLSLSAKEQQHALLSSIPHNSNISIFYEDGTAGHEMLLVTKEYLISKGLPFQEFSYALLQGRGIEKELSNHLNKDLINSVIIISESEAFVSDILRNLNLLSTRGNYRITLYALPKLRGFESVDINYYHSMNLHLAFQYYVDYSRKEVKSFLSKYRALYKVEPTPYAFQGYDIGRYFLGMVCGYGSNFINMLEYNGPFRPLQSDFIFYRKERGAGFSNRGVRVIVYRPDFSIELLTGIR